MKQPARIAAVASPAQVPPVPRGVAVPYRFVVADDSQAWPASSGAGGLLEVSEGEQLDGFDRLTVDGSALVVICGTRQAAAVRRASALARSRSNARVAVVPLSSGPVGQDVVTAMARRLVSVPTGRPVAEIVVQLPVLAGAVLDLGLVSRVSKIDQSAVTLGHHVMSYLPGRRLFAVQITPTGGVVRVTTKGALSPATGSLQRPAFADGYPVTVTVAGNRPVPEVVQAVCQVSTAPAAGPTTRRMVDFWGDQDATEIVVAPTDVHRWMSDQFARPEARPCSWCGEPLTVVMESCVFCGHVVR